MNLLQTTYLGNSVESWLVALGVAIVSFLVLETIKKVFVRRLGAVAARTKTLVDDVIVDLVRRLRHFFLLALALYAGTLALSLSVQMARIVYTLVTIILLLQGAILGNALISFWLSNTMKKRAAEDAAGTTTVSALSFIGRLVLWSVILLLTLDNLGINVTTLITGLGIGGVAVALAIQSILGDLFASLSIVLDKPFVIGDFIIVDELLGSVEHIGLKTTRIRSLSGEQIVFSNSDLLKSRIRNYKRMSERRVQFSIGITYQTPYEKVVEAAKVIREVIEAQPLARFDRAHFKDYGESALIYEAVYYVKTADYNVYMDIQQSINLGLFRRFGEMKVEFAYPTQTLFLRQEIVDPGAEAVSGTGRSLQPSSRKDRKPE
jgi:small-conductance mechanosensitive channel